MFFKRRFVGFISLACATLPFTVATTACALSPTVAFAQTVDRKVIIASWQNQYDAARVAPVTTTAEWQSTNSVTKAPQTTVVVSASSPDGRVYIKAQEGSGQTRVVVYDGKTALVSANPTTFNRINGSEVAQKVVGFYYENYYGFAFSPASLLVNPARHTTKTPRDYSLKVRQMQRLRSDSVRLSFATTEADGLTMPSSIDFTRVGSQWVPTRWHYAVSDSEWEIVVDATTAQNGSVLPTKYRYINRNKGQHNTTVRTVILRYDPLDKSLFALQPTPQQYEIVESATGKTEVKPPTSRTITSE